MTIVKLAIGESATGVCADVPDLLWDFGKSYPRRYAVVFSDTKPRHTTGVYRFTGTGEGIRVYGVPKTPELRGWTEGQKGSVFYLNRITRNLLWGEAELGDCDKLTPKKGYVWAEEI